jgi:hypothetical protein
MTKQERDLFYYQMDAILPMLNEAEKSKLDFVKSFLMRRFQVDDFEHTFINIDRICIKSLMYLLFAMIVEYDDKKI